MTVPPVTTIRDRREELGERALELLGVDTTNPPGETAPLANRVEAWLENLGLTVERVVVDPAKPNLLASVPGDREATLLYLGHMDTVPFDGTEWSRDPLGERDGDRVYGRGATDMKGPLAAMLETVRAFAVSDTSPPVTLGLVLVSDEEVAGDAGLPAVLGADALSAEGCVIGETTSEGGRHSVAVADRGSIWLTLSAQGTGAHGSRPMLGENAIDRLYTAVGTVRDRFGAREPAVPDAVEPVIEESVAYYTPELGETTARELFRRPSINLGTIDGGDRINAVPASARARLDIRLAPGVDTSDVLGEIRACVVDCEGVEVQDANWSVGTYELPASPIVDASAEVAGAVTGDRIYRRSATGGGDAKKLRNAGIPTVEFALGTDTAHAVDEYTTVDALAANAEIYTRLPFEFADRLAKPPD